jgi:hypothetical protein
MLTPAALRAAAVAARAEADRLRLEAAAQDVYAEELERLAEKAPSSTRLRKVNIGAKVNSSMENVHRIAISKGRTGKDPFALTYQTKGFTLRSLAAALEVSPATLAAHRRPKSETNHRPIPESRAARVFELTGWPADARHWPAGIS